VNLRAEGESEIRVLAAVTSEKRISRALVVCVCVRVGASLLKVVVELNTTGWARLGSVVTAAAAVARVGLVTVEVGKARALAADALAVHLRNKLCRAARVQVSWARGYVASSTVGDGHWNVGTINERHIVEITVSVPRKGPLSKRYRWDTSTSVFVANKTTVATTSRTGCWTRVGGKVTIGSRPDTTSFPVIRN